MRNEAGMCSADDEQLTLFLAGKVPVISFVLILACVLCAGGKTSSGTDPAPRTHPVLYSVVVVGHA